MVSERRVKLGSPSMCKLLQYSGFACCLAASSAAQDVTDHATQVQAVAGWQQEDGSHMAGLHMALSPGWKTYWRAPGDGGIPPRFTFDGSHNLSSVSVAFPRPDVFYQYGMRSIGYENQVTFPMHVTATDPGLPVMLNFQIDYGICAEVCIPASAEGSLLIGPDQPGEIALINSALATVPVRASGEEVIASTCELSGTDDGRSWLVASITLADGQGALSEAVMETNNDDHWIGPPALERTGDQLSLVSEFESFTDTPLSLEDTPVRVTLIGTDMALDIADCTPPDGN